MQAIIMAGGFGTRLRPLTNEIPKPMLKVGGRPLLQRTIEQLRASDLTRIWISTGYLADKITDYFGDGHKLGVELCYTHESKPLGTAGALGLFPATSEPLLVTNGDILTQLDYRAMLDYHQEHNADLTMAVHRHTVKIPYGVVESDGSRVTGMREKPELEYCINAGMYVLSPQVHRSITSGERLDMSTLIDNLIKQEQAVIQFPFVDYWLDIGQRADYERAQKEVLDLPDYSRPPTARVKRRVLPNPTQMAKAA